MKSQIESEYKYIIKMPDIAILAVQDNYSSSDIVQIYLLDENGTTHRIRKRTEQGKAAYTENRKTRISPMSVIERERELDLDEYSLLCDKADPKCSPIYKTRHVFSYKGHVLEIDIYPNWKCCAVLEIEVSHEGDNVELPDFIKVVMDVTGDKKYSNHSMARSFPDEPK